MNSNHCSRLLLALVVLLSVAGTATAVTISDYDAPVTSQVESSVEASFTFTELYQNPSWEEWTLEGETNLTDVTWTVTTINQAGNQVDQESTDGQSFEYDIRLEDDVAEVRVDISATVPTVEDDEWSYEPPQQTTIASFQQVREGGTSNDIGEAITLRPYTDESDRARQAIEEADGAIDGAGGDSNAENKLQQAIDAFDEGSFTLAEDLANEAREDAQSSQQRSQLLRLATFGLIAIVLIAVVGGGLYWYRSNRTGSKL